MPVYEFECIKCGLREDYLLQVGGTVSHCSIPMRRLLSPAAIVIPGNMGPKLKTRVALDDELKKNGFTTPLFSSPEAKDFSRWALKKEGIR